MYNIYLFWLVLIYYHIWISLLFSGIYKPMKLYIICILFIILILVKTWLVYVIRNQHWLRLDLGSSILEISTPARFYLPKNKWFNWAIEILCQRLLVLIQLVKKKKDKLIKTWMKISPNPSCACMKLKKIF